MATLYVENFPDDLYQALKNNARLQRKSLAQEVIAVLEKHVPTTAELEKRRRLLRKVMAMTSRKATSTGPFPTTDEMLREDRLR